MKRVLTILLTLLMILTLAGCKSSEKEEEPVVDTPEVIEPIKEEEPEIVGGYVDAEDKTITPELNGIFATAMQGLLGASYEAKELVATQVVAGTNYKFLAEGTKTTNPITKGTYYIYIYEDLQGNIELKDIEVIEEKQEEVKTVDPTQYSYWVVFYDQYGNELQRTVEDYGTVPVFKGTLPEGFINWANKNTNDDITTFNPITTNTYFVAKCQSAHLEENINLPNKGELIKVYVGTGVTGADADGNMMFRVLSKNGRICKLLGYNSIEDYEFNNQPNIDFGGISAIAYDGGHIDTKLSSWYETLDSSVKNAIKSTRLKQHLVELIDEFEQGAVQLHGLYYKIDKYIELANDKYVFALDVDDVMDYLDGTLSAEGIKNMLSINGNSKEIWTRCAGYDHIHPCENNVAVRMSNTLYCEISLEPIGGDPIANIVPCFYIDLTANGIIYETYSEN